MELSEDHLIKDISRFAPLLWKAHLSADGLRHWTIVFTVDNRRYALMMTVHDEYFDRGHNIMCMIDFEIFDIFYLRAVYLTPAGHLTDKEGTWHRKPVIIDRFHESSFRLDSTTTNDEFEYIMMMLALHLPGGT